MRLTWRHYGSPPWIMQRLEDRPLSLFQRSLLEPNMAAQLIKEVVPVNNIPTVVTRMIPKSHAYRVVIVVIPGNPGLVEFYDEFITTLFHTIGASCPVYGISHAGHSPTEDYPRNKYLDNHSLSPGNVTRTHYLPLSLEDQIDHKRIFLEEHIPLHLKIILIGHSIGAYVILNILKKCNRTADVRKAILLFPTIERMAASPSGRYVTPMVTYFRWLAVGAAAAFSVLPEFVKRGLVWWWLNDKEQLKPATVDSVIKFLKPTSMNRCVTMAQDEMTQVVHLDEQVVAQHLKKLIFYYGASDPWAPVSYYEDMKTKFPDGEIYLCQRNFQHAFVLESSVDVARMIATWIQEIM